MRSLFIAIAAAVIAAPALAQSAPPPPPSDTAPRQKFVEIVKGEACPRSTDPNEIVVCRTIDPDTQYRIPPLIREQQAIAREDNVREQRAGLVDANVSGAGSCSSVGVAGQYGCTQGLNVLGAGASIVKAAQGEDVVPDKVPQ